MKLVINRSEVIEILKAHTAGVLNLPTSHELIVEDNWAIPERIYVCMEEEA